MKGTQRRRFISYLAEWLVSEFGCSQASKAPEIRNVGGYVSYFGWFPGPKTKPSAQFSGAKI